MLRRIGGSLVRLQQAPPANTCQWTCNAATANVLSEIVRFTALAFKLYFSTALTLLREYLDIVNYDVRLRDNYDGRSTGVIVAVNWL
jgi:hypothetical protein